MSGKNKPIKGYKVFNPDWTCDGLQYKVGETYEMKKKPFLCGRGFHFCLNLTDCFKYCTADPENKIAEIEALGEITEIEDNCSKLETNKIKIIKEIDRQDAYKIGNQGQNCTGYGNTGAWNTGYWNAGNRNAGDRNTGYWNAGHRNAGDWNTGYWNAGNRNTGNRNTGSQNTGCWNAGNRNAGDRNTGYWNTVDCETGYLNSEQSKYIRIFNKRCLREEWESATKPNFLYFKLAEWIDISDMTAQEKSQNPNHVTLKGYLRKWGYKEAFINSFNKAEETEIKQLLDLPNFNYKVFEKISGITKEMIQDKLRK